MGKKFLLSEGWKFRIKDKNTGIEKFLLKKIKPGDWLNAKIPGIIVTDLLNNELIPDPFAEDNELKLQWISEYDWIYVTVFNIPKDFDKACPVYLVFEGVDTAATIFFNGKELGNVNNMFLKYEFDISNLLKKKRNKLEVAFSSPIRYAKELETRYGRLSAALNSERVYIRKAQYSFGWDWGPKFPAAGLWRPVYLVQHDEIYIENFTFTTLSLEKDKAIVEFKVNLNRSLNSLQEIKLELKNNNQNLEFEIKGDNSRSYANQFEIKNPDLWWPNGLGGQNLYDLSIKIIDGASILNELKKKVGIRTIKLILFENEKQVFRFEVNNFPVFLRGANWIPGDSFLPRVSENKYRSLLQSAKEANMNILRVWGGGIYENDIFYEICDELGLLVWQDFMFACAPYPEHEDFIQNIEKEISYNVYRLQHHVSVAIWCGNNENEWIWYQQSGPYNEMPGYKIFHEIIPGILSEIDPHRPYRQSSPFGNDDDPNSVNSGNRHQWDLWSRWTDYNKVKDDASLFVTEFGFQAPANQSTLEEVIPEEERNIQSYLFEFHNKQIEGNERLIKFLYSHLPLITKWDEFIYLAQLNQALALKKCLEYWRLNQPHTNGSIIWQLNDTWPVTSWSLIDSGLIPKLSYYLVKKSFQNQVLFMNKVNESLEVSLFNNDRKRFSGWIELHNIYLPKGKVESITNKKTVIREYGKKTVASLAVPDFIKKGEGIIISSLYSEDGELVYRNYYLEKEWKYLKLPETKLKIKFKSKTGNPLAQVTSNLPAFFVYLQSSDYIFKDNGFILLPGEKFYTGIMKRKSSNKEKITYFCLNQFLH